MSTITPTFASFNVKIMLPGGILIASDSWDFLAGSIVGGIGFLVFAWDGHFAQGFVALGVLGGATALIGSPLARRFIGQGPA